MRLAPHPRYVEFSDWFVRRLSASSSIDAEFFRAAGPFYTAPRQILTGKGAQLGGGRWNGPQTMLTVYLSQSPDTALAESIESQRYHGLPLSKAMPKVIVAVYARIDGIMDLTSAGLASELSVPIAHLLAENWRAVMNGGNEATPQAIGRAAYQAGLKGILVPSKADLTGTNLVIFPERMIATDSMILLNPDELEELGKPT